MKVYVVTSDYGYDSNDFEGVFSTQEKAEDFIEKLFGKNSTVADWTEVELDENSI